MGGFQAPMAFFCFCLETGRSISEKAMDELSIAFSVWEAKKKSQ